MSFICSLTMYSGHQKQKRLMLLGQCIHVTIHLRKCLTFCPHVRKLKSTFPIAMSPSLEIRKFWRADRRYKNAPLVRFSSTANSSGYLCIFLKSERHSHSLVSAPDFVHDTPAKKQESFERKYYNGWRKCYWEPEKDPRPFFTLHTGLLCKVLIGQHTDLQNNVLVPFLSQCILKTV